MSYVALYRKFRPQAFDRVMGQEHVVRTLKNQIKYNRIGHAYLFTGTRGTGKTTIAKIFAKAINCLNPVDGSPCNECENCKAAASDSFIDTAEFDAASHTSVDDIRRIIEEISYKPNMGRYKIYIIDEVHMLSNSAFNAFLKTLEEPPEHVIFILATTEPHKLPITILSRVQRYDFHRIGNDTIVENLSYLLEQENIEAEKKALMYIAKAGDGSMRDSISLLDKCITFNLGEKLTYENVLATLGAMDTEIFSKIFRSVAAGNAVAAIEEIENAVNSGKDMLQFISDFVWYIRNLMLANVNSSTEADALGVSEDNMEVIRQDAKLVSAEVLMRYIRILSELINKIRFSSTKQIEMEVAFIKLAKPEMETDNASLADRIRQLEQKLSSAPVYAAAQPIAPQPAAPIAPQPAAQPEPAPSFYISDDDDDEYEPEDLYDPFLEDDGYEYAPEPAPEPVKPGPEPEPKAPAPQTKPIQTKTASGAAKTVVDNWAFYLDLMGMMSKVNLRKTTAKATGPDQITLYMNEPGYEEVLKVCIKELKEAVKSQLNADIDIILSKKSINEMGNDAFPEELLNKVNFEIGTEEI